jgi:hypothetical protein
VTYHYHSCGNRHCPSCGGAKRAAWLEKRRAELLAVPYFHVVFTLPHELSALALGNRKALYSLLFDAAAQTLLQVAAEPKRLGARIGALTVLHTWGQQLEHHPHVHAVVPGGGLSADGATWIACRPNFFVPVKVLGRVFRGKFLEGLRRAYDTGQLQFAGSTSDLAEAAPWRIFVTSLYAKDWVVYAKKPFGGPEQVLKYLTGYTHRVALSNRRLVKLDNGHVTLTYKDYADGCRHKRLTLETVEFLRRFALHIVPKGFVRVRHYGLLAHRGRGARLAKCRALLAVSASASAAPTLPPPTSAVFPAAAVAPASLALALLAAALLPAAASTAPPPSTTAASATAAAPVAALADHCCPACGQGRLTTLWRDERPSARQLAERWRWDTS